MLPPQVSPVGGRLSNFVEGWKRITNDPYVLSIVAKGYRLRFTSPPLLRQIPWEIRSPQDPKEVLSMREQIALMLQKNAITEVPPDSPGFYSNVFLVRKASGGWRPVIDLKNLNAHIHAPHFRMFTTSFVLSSVEKGDYAFKIDLQDAYFHVPIHPSSRKYLGFAFENRVYQFQVLPFGLNTAPQVFTRLGHTVTAYLHRQGVSVIPYLDDWLVHHPDRQILLRHQALLIDTLDLVGFILNRKKSELNLTQDLQFLGIHLRLDLGRALLPESKAGEIVACTRHLSSLKVLNYSQVSHLMGSLNWASGLIPLYLRPLQRHFHSLGLTNRFTPPRQSDPVVLANLLQQWLDPHFLTSGIQIRPLQADYTIFTDASSQGWGAHMGDSKISGIWTRIDRKLHINCLELKAVTCALQHWAPLLQGHQVMIATDNSTVVSYINKQGGTRSTSLLRLTELFLWLESQGIIVRARHIPGCMNVIADHLSRPNQSIPTEWSLHPEIVKRIFRVWGTPEVDMFATLPRFMSPVPEPRALAVDALSQDWQGRSMYMFPPFPLLNRVVQKLRSTQAAEVILVAPWWTSQPWFPHLLRLCVEHPLTLPYRQDLLSQQDQKYISDGKSFHLHVWRLSCDTTKQQVFQTRSLGSRQLLGDPRPIACTTTDGVISHDGLRDKLLIHLTPQPLRQPHFSLIFLIFMACPLEPLRGGVTQNNL